MVSITKTAALFCLCMVTSISVAGATFHLGDRGSQISAIQQALVKQGSAITVDGDYGAGTQAAVRAFQASHGLEADGIVGEQTYAALMGDAMPENLSSQYAAGATTRASAVADSAAFPLVTAQNEVKVVQEALRAQGYTVDVDGLFGVGTEQAVRAYQAANGLEADGVVGQETFYSLTGQVLPTGPIRRFGNGGFGSSKGTAVNSGLAKRLLGIASQYEGVPYVFGGTSPSGFDCSGFTRYVYSAVGVDLPRMADEQYGIGNDVSMSNLAPGDLVFFSTYTAGVSHVGIYIGDNQFINASSDGVSVASLNSSYWSSHYVGAKRVI